MLLQEQGWLLRAQDAGQVHLLGWGYVQHWEKQGVSLWLHYQEIQGRSEAQLQIEPAASESIQTLVEAL